MKIKKITIKIEYDDARFSFGSIFVPEEFRTKKDIKKNLFKPQTNSPIEWFENTLKTNDFDSNNKV